MRTDKRLKFSKFTHAASIRTKGFRVSKLINPGSAAFDSAVVTVSDTAYTGFSFVLNVILARMLSVPSFGIWRLALQLQGYLLLGISNPVEMAFARRAQIMKQSGKLGITLIMFSALFLGIGIAIALLLPWLRQVLGLGNEQALIDVLGVWRLWLPIGLLFPIFLGTLLGLRRFAHRGFARNLQLLLVIGAILVVGLTVGLTVADAWALLGFSFFASLVVVAYILRADLREGIRSLIQEGKPDLSVIRETWSDAGWFLIGSLFSQGVLLLPLLMLKAAFPGVIGSEYVAFYGVASLGQQMLTAIPSSVGAALIPRVHASTESFVPALLFIGISGCILSTIAILFAPTIISIIWGAEYLGGTDAFRIFAVGAIAEGIHMLFVSFSFGRGLVRVKAISEGLSFLIALVASLALISRYELIGASIAVLLALVGSSLMDIILLRKELLSWIQGSASH